MTSDIQVVVNAKNRLGEGILWDHRIQALYWTNIQAATLWRYWPARDQHQIWHLSERLGSFALCQNERYLLMALASKLAFFDLTAETLHPICLVEPDLPTRCNDGAVDRQGRFVFGTMHEPSDGNTQQALGSFWRLNTDRSLERLPLESVAISNSLAFSRDGKTMYYCDSPTRTIRCCDYGDMPSHTRDFVKLDGADGTPDGSCIDTEDGLWNAQWGLGQIARYRADGTLDRIVQLPTSQPTRPTFGGPHLNTIYITSATESLLHDEPLAGTLIATDTAFQGLPEPIFGGIPTP